MVPFAQSDVKFWRLPFWRCPNSNVAPTFRACPARSEGSASAGLNRLRENAFKLSFRAKRGISPWLFSRQCEIPRRLRLLGMTGQSGFPAACKGQRYAQTRTPPEFWRWHVTARSTLTGSAIWTIIYTRREGWVRLGCRGLPVASNGYEANLFCGRARHPSILERRTFRSFAGVQVYWSSNRTNLFARGAARVVSIGRVHERMTG